MAGGANRATAILIDLFAFATGLGMAFFLGWRTRDLVWSLWLSSLVVGYATLVVTIVRSASRASARLEGHGRPLAVGLPLAGGAFLLAFFTVHFGGFHFVHSVFLNLLFPVRDPKTFPDAALYLGVAREYWPFLIATLLAERGALLSAWNADLDLRRAGRADLLHAPYRNVVRMHLLIFFFFFASILGLDSFLVYAVVFAVYFFPWRTVFGRGAGRDGLTRSTLSPGVPRG